MNISELIELLDDKHEGNNGECCAWCESDSYPVNKDGERIGSTEDADHYRFDCDDDCLERLIPEALEILRQAVEHPGTKPPDDRRNVQVKCTRYPGWITAYCEYAGTWLTVPGLYSAGDVSIWRELPAGSEVTK